MPVSRSHRTTHRAAPLNHVDQEVIVLSSDDDEPRVPVVHRRKITPRMSKNLDILELSSDDDARAKIASSSSQIHDLKSTVEKLKQDNARLEAELRTLKQSAQSDGNKLVINYSELEDGLCCEICTLRLWSPFLLPECGHVFCQSCLHDWFETALAQHKVAHQHYNAATPTAIPQKYIDGLSGVLHANQRYQLLIFNQMAPPRPAYTCPSCRTAVLNKPVEVYSVKGLVRTVAKAQGEQSPQKAPLPKIKGKGRAQTGRGGRGQPTPPVGPWDTFFL